MHLVNFTLKRNYIFFVVFTENLVVLTAPFYCVQSSRVAKLIALIQTCIEAEDKRWKSRYAGGIVREFDIF